MDKKVNFYIPIIYCNSEPTATPINSFIDHINNFDVEERETKIDGEYYSIIKFRTQNEKNDIKDNYLCMGRYRSKKPKQGERGTDKLDDIDFDIVEPISIYHYDVNNLFMYEYNHFGPRKTKIERYFSSFLVDNNEEKWEFKLVPIEKTFNIDELRQAEQIKFIEMSFSLNDKLKDLDRLDENNTISPITEMMSAISNFLQNDGGNLVDIKISNGRFSRNQLDQETMMIFIELILQNNLNEEFAKLNVRYKLDNGEIKTVNLSDYGFYTSIIKREEGLDGWEYIVDKVEEDYHENHYNILNRKVSKYLSGLKYIDRIYTF